jgi:DNA-binding NarL/FixJ family response regulator
MQSMKSSSRDVLSNGDAVAQVSVLLVDDHPVMRAGVKALLSAERDLRVVAEADNGQAAVTQASNSLPAVILMDVSLPQ